jgi:hypothetical protein
MASSSGVGALVTPTPGNQKTPSNQHTRMIARITPIPPLGP